MNRIISVIALFLITFSLSAHSFEQIRAMGSDKPVSLNGTLDGIVISDWRSDNVEYNPNLDHNVVDLGENLRTAYVESFDGCYGIRLKFESIYGNRLQRGDMVRITLDGCTLIKEQNPERYTINGLRPENVRIARRGMPVPVKKKHIDELVPEDVYTYVSLEGIEFHQKTGGYINIYEKCAQTTVLNKDVFCENPPYAGSQNASDTWARLLKDDKGAQIYALINSICEWRRNDLGVPQGIGELSGVIVHTQLPRYGSSLGEYSIRPLDISDISISRECTSSFVPLAQWTYDYNKYAEIHFEKAGKKRFVKPNTIRGDAIMAETGAGKVWTDSGASLSLDDEFDARHSFDGWKSARMTGSRSNAALRLDCKSSDWFCFNDKGRVDGYHSVYVETSTAGVESKKVYFDFSFIASREHSKQSEGFPIYWKLSYSCDGEEFKDIDRMFILRPQCYVNVQHGNILNVPVHSEVAMGFTEFSVKLPDEVCGRKSLIVKLSPASDVISVFPEKWNQTSASGRADLNNNKDVIIRFGTIAIKYLK